MKLIVGLGNPGEKYRKTRHNVGFMVVDRFVDEAEWKESKGAKALYLWIGSDDEKIELIKPLTMMNKSGLSVAYVKKKHPKLELNDIFVIHDDLDIRLGSFKIQEGKGPREHRGVKSVEDALGGSDFWRVRVGVDGRAEGDRSVSGEEYVLGKFKPDELKLLEEVLEKVVEELKDGLT